MTRALRSNDTQHAMAISLHTRRVVAIALLLLASAVAGPLASVGASASTWMIAANQQAAALARSLALQPPSTVTATCTAPLTDRTITVSWTPVSYATSYVVYESTTSSTAGFTTVATDVTATTWITGTLKKATYWYAVAAVIGSPSWISTTSAASQGRTITTVPRCT